MVHGQVFCQIGIGVSFASKTAVYPVRAILGTERDSQNLLLLNVWSGNCLWNWSIATFSYRNNLKSAPRRKSRINCCCKKQNNSILSEFTHWKHVSDSAREFSKSSFVRFGAPGADSRNTWSNVAAIECLATNTIFSTCSQIQGLLVLKWNLNDWELYLTAMTQKTAIGIPMADSNKWRDTIWISGSFQLLWCFPATFICSQEVILHMNEVFESPLLKFS